MKFNPLILVGGTVGFIVILIVFGRLAENSGASPEQTIGRILGLLLAIIIGAVVIKSLFFRKR